MPSECPECRSPLSASATYCGCGWGRKKSGSKSQAIENCAWVSASGRCRYPGTISHNTQGMGPWYCRFHAKPDLSASYGEQVVIESKGYQPRMMAERDHDAVHMPYAGPRACQERSCMKLAIAGSDLCAKHAGMPDVQRVGKIRTRFIVPVMGSG